MDGAAARLAWARAAPSRQAKAEARQMTRNAILAALCALCCATPSRADPLIRQANDQESLIIGVAHVHLGEQARDSAGAPVLNEEAGSQLVLGYGSVRTRALFGVPGFYTDLEIALGGADVGYAGTSFDPTTGLAGSAGATRGGFDVASETVRARVGRTREFGRDGRLALTPYLGLAQQGWVRTGTVYTPFSGYGDAAAQLGLLAQAALTRKIVLGADAAIGRTIGAMALDGHNLDWPHRATTSTFALYLDNRTFAAWHQRLEIRHSSQRYGEPAYGGGLLEPRRGSVTSILLEFGTEQDLLHTLLY